MKLMFCLGSMGKGGAERVTTNLANYLIKDNAVSIVTTTSIDTLYKIDSKVMIKALDNIERKTNFIVRNIKRIKNLKKIIKNDNPDLIISFLPEPTYRVLITNLFNKRKIIVSVRNDPKVEYNTLFKKILMKILFKRANGFVFQTEEAKQFFSKKIQLRSIIIPNPLNPDFIIERYEGKREKKIVNVGRLESQKNQKLLIDAFNIVQKKYPDYELHIYGDGSLRENLQTQINRLKIENKVFLHGIIDNVREEIYKAKLFVLSSDYEGMPNALMEAMSLGISCISTDCPCGGPRFLIQNNENGILVPVNDVNAMSDSILSLIENAKKCDKIGKNATMIGQLLNPDCITNTWLKYIDQIVKK